MIERALIALMLIAAGFLAYRLMQRRQLRRAGSTATNDPILGDNRSDVPTIVYFTTPTCAPCRLQQTPILDRLQMEMGENNLRTVRIDASEDPETAARWGVFSVPTTFVLDETGQPRNVHNGVVGIETLREELRVS